MSNNQYYTLTTPCKKCPFRNDIDPYIRPGRVLELEQALAGGGTFTCHKTTVESEEDEDGWTEMIDGPNARFCAGAMILVERDYGGNQMLRIAERLGMYDAEKLNMDAPVYDSFGEMYEVHLDIFGEDDEVEEEGDDDY